MQSALWATARLGPESVWFATLPAATSPPETVRRLLGSASLPQFASFLSRLGQVLLRANKAFVAVVLGSALPPPLAEWAAAADLTAYPLGPGVAPRRGTLSARSACLLLLPTSWPGPPPTLCCPPLATATSGRLPSGVRLGFHFDHAWRFHFLQWLLTRLPGRVQNTLPPPPPAGTLDATATWRPFQAPAPPRLRCPWLAHDRRAGLAPCQGPAASPATPRVCGPCAWVARTGGTASLPVPAQVCVGNLTSRCRPDALPFEDVRVDRTSPLGNPFPLRHESDQEESARQQQRAGH